MPYRLRTYSSAASLPARALTQSTYRQSPTPLTMTWACGAQGAQDRAERVEGWQELAAGSLYVIGRPLTRANQPTTSRTYPARQVASEEGRSQPGGAAGTAPAHPPPQCPA